MTAQSTIPVVDLRNLEATTVEDRNLLAVQLVEAFHNIGFVYLINHKISDDKITDAFFNSKQFFERPVEKKLKFKKKNASEGYHGAYSQDAENTKISLKSNNENLYQNAPAFDFRESFDIFGTTTFNNISLDSVDKHFFKSMKDLQNECQTLCTYLLKLLAIGLEITTEDFFVEKFKWLQDSSVKSFKTFRSLYYPAIPENILISAEHARVKEHSDHGYITLLFQDDVGGLEVKHSQGYWIPAPPLKGSIIVNMGDLLEFWSNGYLPATKHRVLIPPEEIQRRSTRQSIVYFLHPDANTTMTPLQSRLVEPSDHEPMLAGDFAKAKLATVRSY